MKLDALFDRLAVTLRQGSGAVHIHELTDDSREVTPASLFIARPGHETDGSAYIADAIERGAAAILTEPMATPAAIAEHPKVAWAVADTVDQPLCGELAERFFDRPSQKLRVLAVTGTNGKTTTAFVAQHLLLTADVRAGLMGTVVVDDGQTRSEAGLTTPGAIAFSRLLHRMAENGCGAAVCEVSSHALDQGRTAALAIDVGVFTNLTGDHLDYHGSMEAYAAAKAKLFTQLPPRGWAIVNRDDPYADTMLSEARCRVMWTTLQPESSTQSPRGAEANSASRQSDASTPAAPVCRAQINQLAADHSEARFDGPWGSFHVRLPLVGYHNVANALQATAAANVLASLARRLKRGLQNCPNVPGRLEVVTADRDHTGPLPRIERPAVLVDYAHTHDALENVLRALEAVTAGELIVVFGCGGDRDTAKRPKMAEVAARIADRLYVTSDNPRTEDPDAIIQQIMQGVPAHKRDVTTVEPDRAAAIARAVADAEPRDAILIAGKGHEDYQIIGTEKRHFDDREHAAAALRAYGTGRRSSSPTIEPGNANVH